MIAALIAAVGFVMALTIGGLVAAILLGLLLNVWVFLTPIYYPTALLPLNKQEPHPRQERPLLIWRVLTPGDPR